MHKRYEIGGKKKAWRKKIKYNLGRQPANTKLPSNKTVHWVRVRGCNGKWHALRIDTGSYSWGSEAVTRKTHILNVVCNASNNELVRTQTLVKCAIVQVDATPFKQWYLQHYGVGIGYKKKTAAKKRIGNVFIDMNFASLDWREWLFQRVPIQPLPFTEFCDKHLPKVAPLMTVHNSLSYFPTGCGNYLAPKSVLDDYLGCIYLNLKFYPIFWLCYGTKHVDLPSTCCGVFCNTCNYATPAVLHRIYVDDDILSFEHAHLMGFEWGSDVTSDCIRALEDSILFYALGNIGPSDSWTISSRDLVRLLISEALFVHNHVPYFCIGCLFSVQKFEMGDVLIVGLSPNNSESSYRVAGNAHEVQAGVIPLATPQIDHSLITTLKNDILKLFDGVERYDDGTCYFHEKLVGALEHQSSLSTSASVRGITVVARVTSGKLHIPREKKLGLANFFLGIGIPGGAKDLYHQIDTLNCLEKIRESTPLILFCAFRNMGFSDSGAKELIFSFSMTILDF